MKGKFLVAFLSLFLFSFVCVSAQKYEVEFDKTPKYIVVAQYSEQKLSNMEIVTPEENTKSTEVETDASEFYTYLIYEEEIVPAVVNKIQEEIKDTTEKDNMTEKEFPDVYDIEKDANRAMMLVDSVSYTTVENENFYELNVFFHGELKTFRIPEEITISNTPDEYAVLNGEEVSALKRGDVVWITAGFNGQVRAVKLLFRPKKENVVFSTVDFGVGFNTLFSSMGRVGGESSYKMMTPQTGVVNSGYGYAFGVVTMRENAEIELRDKSGNSLNFDVADGAIVYISDVSENFKIEKGTEASVRKSPAARKAIDEDGNFISWSLDGEYNYAFVRTIDGEATEIVLYRNY